MTELTILPIAEAARLPKELCETLFPERMQRAALFRRQEDRLRCIAAGALTALVLGAKEPELSVNPWGKPLWTAGSRCFSLSHSGDYALLAADETAVGADLEQNGPVKPRTAARVFTDAELAWLERQDETGFFMLWTLKESVMKLDGRGLSLSPRQFSVLPLLSGGAISMECGEIYGYTRQFRDCTLSVCALHPPDAPPIRLLTAEELLERSR